jgi:hypothetical protein
MDKGGEVEVRSAVSLCQSRGKMGRLVHGARGTNEREGGGGEPGCVGVTRGGGGSGRLAEAWGRRRRAVSSGQRQSGTGRKQGRMGRPGEEGKMSPTQEHSINFHLFQIFQLRRN